MMNDKEYSKFISNTADLANRVNNKKSSVNKEVKREKKSTTVKSIKTALYIAGGIALGVLAKNQYDLNQGARILNERFDNATSSWNYESSDVNGYSIMYVDENGIGHEVDFEDGIKGIVKDALKFMDEDEVRVALGRKISPSAVSIVFEEDYPNYQERCDVYKQCLYENKLDDNKVEAINEKGKGNSL